MFVIIHNNSVILGPMRWNKRRFENEILEECEVEVSLPDFNNLQPVIVSDEVKILPVQSTPDPSYNPKIEFLNGPFWQFTETAAISSYQVEQRNIDAVKNQLIAEVANERWKRETLGVKTTIQQLEVTVDTARGNRDIFVQKYLLMGDADTVQWKFPEGWLTLTKSDLGQCVAAGASYVQSQFDWEASKLAEISACTTLGQLNDVVVAEMMQQPGAI